MPRALSTAASGMVAQQLKIDVISNNLANVNTTGFKRTRAEFQDMLYQTMRTAGAASSRETAVPTGLQVGHGTRAVSTERNWSPGDFVSTENELDVAIEGAGMFQLRAPGGELVFSRDGAFKIDANGQLVNADGYPLEPPIVVPADTVRLSIAPDGLVSAFPADGGRPVELGNIELMTMLNTGALESMGRNLYHVSGDPGNMVVTAPGSQGAGTLSQGFLESSNVRVVEEMIAMIVGQRAYEASAKVIKAADEMLAETNRLR